MLKQLRRYKLGVQLDGDPDRIFEQLNKDDYHPQNDRHIVYHTVSRHDGLWLLRFVLVMVYAIIYFYATRRINPTSRTTIAS